MADDLYNPSFSFAGFQSNNPGTPLPAQQVDDQFARVSAAIETLSEYLAQVRRADGALQNQTVTLDALDADLLGYFQAVQAVTVTDLSPTALATETEASQGQSHAKLMTPLRVAGAIDARRPYASQVEAAAGTVSNRVMSPGLSTAHFNGRFITALLSPVFPTISSGASFEVSVTVTGATVNMPVLLGLPSNGPPAGLIISAWVSAVNTARVRFFNGTSSPLAPASGQYKLVVVKL